MLDRRKESASTPQSRREKGVELPVQYRKMVAQVMTEHFQEGLRMLSEHLKGPLFSVQGGVYSDEVLLAVSLISEGEVAATTVYASADFDPRASTPTAEELLSLCVDGVGSVLSSLLDPENPDRIAQVAEKSLGALEEIPFEWTEAKMGKRKIYVKVDKANPALEKMTDEWLAQNDPEHEKRQREDEAEAEKLFVTADSVKKKTPLH